MIEGWLVAVVAGLFGLLLGSFLNVCSLRWPIDESIVSPGSRCPKCLEPVQWFDNVPVLSWVILRGRCRFCSEPISVQYPLVEFATGLMWAGVFAAHGPTPEALRGAVFLTILFGIAVSDARFFIIPDQFSLGGAVIGFGMASFPGGIEWLDSLIGAVVGYGVLWFVGCRRDVGHQEGVAGSLGRGGCGSSHGRWRYQDDDDGRRLRGRVGRGPHDLLGVDSSAHGVWPNRVILQAFDSPRRLPRCSGRDRLRLGRPDGGVVPHPGRRVARLTA